MPPPASPCRSTATSTRASRTPPSRASRSASRASRADSAPSPPPSGLSAQYITFASLAGAGDHIVASANLYGGSITQLDVTLRRFGVETTFVRSSDPADYAAAITDKTKALFVETIANPSGEIADLEGLADVAHAHGIPLIVDSTIPTPYLNRPIEWGADIVTHSATKFLGGARHDARRRRRRVGPLPLAHRAVPAVRAAGAELRRAAVVGQLRRVRVPHAPARRAAARHRPGPRAALGVPARAGRRDAAVPHPGARRQRARRRRVARGRPAHRARVVGGPAEPPAPRARRRSTCRRARARCSASRSRAAARSARRSSSR